MTKRLRELLIGTLLGDAHIKKVGSDKAYITFEQSKKKSEYINYLFEQSKEEGLALKSDSLKEYNRFDDRYNSTNSSLYFRSEASEELRPLADLFLNEEGKKVIPSNISDHLSPRSLAFWIMDDGQRVKNGGVTLCTDSYNSTEIEILRLALTSKFDFVTTIHKKKVRMMLLMKEFILIKIL